MMYRLHAWLMFHTITRELLEAIIVALLLIPVNVYGKSILALFKVPPEHLTGWWRKARLDAASSELSSLIRAHSEPDYKLLKVLGYVTLTFAYLGFMLLNITVLLAALVIPTQPLYPSTTVNAVSTVILRSRSWQIMYFTLPFDLMMFQLYRLIFFTLKLTRFEVEKQNLLKKVNRLRQSVVRSDLSSAKRANHETSGVVSTALYEENVRKLPSEGTRVMHPKYGEGVIVRRDGYGDLAKVTVQFEVGLRKLVEKFAQLEII